MAQRCESQSEIGGKGGFANTALRAGDCDCFIYICNSFLLGKSTLSAGKRRRSIGFWQTLVMTRLGKVQHSKLMEKASSQEGSHAARLERSKTSVCS